MLTKIIDSVLYLVHYNLCLEIVEFIIASNKIFLSIKKEDNHCMYTSLKSTQRLKGSKYTMLVSTNMALLFCKEFLALSF